VRLLALVLATLLAGLTVPILQAPGASAAEGDPSYLVSFASGTSADAQEAAIAAAGATDVDAIPQLRIHAVTVPAATEDRRRRRPPRGRFCDRGRRRQGTRR
jgi:hypothetical protein